jgi:hypothetical protein
MGMGAEYFAGLDVFAMGWFSALFMFCFLLIFTYLGIRATEDKAWDKAVQIAALSMAGALLASFLNIPSIWVGVILVFVFILAQKSVLKQDMKTVAKNFLPLWIMLFIFSMVPDWLRLPFSGFSIVYFYVQSEIEVKREKMKSKDKPKK